MQTAIRQSVRMDSNPLFVTTAIKPLWGSITSPELIFGGKTELTSLRSDTVFTSSNYNQSIFSSNDVSSKLDFMAKVQRWAAGIKAKVDYDSTLTSEITNFNNLSTKPVRHVAYTLAPEVSYKFLPTDRIVLGAEYSASEYEVSSFTNSEVVGMNLAYDHDFDQMNTGSFIIKAQRFRATTGSSNIVDSIGPSVGWRAILTERLTGKATMGVQMVRQKTPAITDPTWRTRLAFSTELGYKDDQNTAVLKASRSQFSFGNGSEAFLTQVSLRNAYDINEKLTVGADLSYKTADYPSNANGNLDSLATAAGTIAYHVTEHIDIAGNYQYQHESVIGRATTAHRNIAMLSIVYRPNGWKLY